MLSEEAQSWGAFASCRAWIAETSTECAGRLEEDLKISEKSAKRLNKMQCSPTLAKKRDCRAYRCQPREERICLMLREYWLSLGWVTVKIDGVGNVLDRKAVRIPSDVCGVYQALYHRQNNPQWYS